MASDRSPAAATWRTPAAVLVAASLCILLVMGIRSSFGLYLKPMSLDLGWGREVFALAMAIQNLVWGAAQPFASAIAERYGTGRVIVGGGLLYIMGLVIMAQAADPLTFHLGGGVLIGMAQAGGGLAVLLGAVGRAMPPEKRSWGLGVVGAAGAAGQFTVVPVGQAFLQHYGWATSYLLLAVLAAGIVASAHVLKGRAQDNVAAAEDTGPRGLGAALAEASHHRGYWLLVIGFFVCGFQVAFIGIHLPAYLTDRGLPAETGAWALALVGLFNIVGSYYAGVMGTHRSKKNLLSMLYLSRAVVIAIFISIPASTLTVAVFAAVLGILWLSTVPLTSGLVAQIFGPRYMGTLFAITFFSHQIGSFLGVWLGGHLFDLTGSYDIVWWLSVALGVAAAMIHWPIDERTIPRLATSG